MQARTTITIVTTLTSIFNHNRSAT
jgi:hypothetical protein